MKTNSTSTVSDSGTPLKVLKKGDFFRVKSSSIGCVLIKGDYDRSLRKYECRRYDDINCWEYLSPATIVYTTFVLF